MKIATLYPGQGAQAVGMGKELVESSAACRALFDRASEVLGFDLAKLCAEGPIEELTRSCNTQPAIFAVSAAARTALREAGAPEPALSAGLSSGEWAALWDAGVVSFEDALRILRARGTYMQEACEATPGGMVTVIGLPPAKVEEIAASVGLEVANYNSPLQTVMSGRADRLADGEAAAKAAGAKRALRLTVAGAFHTSLMAPAAEKLGEFLKGVELKAPRIPVWSNVTGKPHGGPEEIRASMVAQVSHSVRWAECFADMAASGMERAFECGPGSVLAGLAKRMAPTAPVASVGDPASAAAALAEIG
ncbi:MAG: ACP S-malonyltransferase [Kiritimatiellae bacterium]|nr:ACP S-malonyltransferase [Kiritimatiellia bacterium]